MDDKKVNTEERKSDEAKIPVNTEDQATAVVITITGPIPKKVTTQKNHGLLMQTNQHPQRQGILGRKKQKQIK